ncbi:DegQ family serine endoprotease [Helicobacter kayseriensis]|uniref:DegQ family serine endoprotease n=1 Tax=Helicobacter kayseriensis TaxID=2905877 RepID=UPI001E2AB5B2|nr:DegQ family serine endoprotease [Helicobacter kayseriensis]MCE3047506.1 DegQ family serine endoprotease [Helicobacter kayseriensis]MCE3048761.1 DegQ family serine endoprotease [Helicobacter kayseriensis]
MKHKVFIPIALSVSLLLGFDVQEMPSVQERVFPDIGQTKVYSFNSSIEEASKVVVNISTQKKIKNQMSNHPMFNDPFFQQFFGDFYNQIPREKVERSLGSGVIISNDGYIITNNHVIDGADKVIVSLPGSNKEYQAKVIGTDSRTDLAVIKIEEKNLPAVKFADSSLVKVGDLVFAIGNPFGVGETITQGIVSALNKNGIGINDYENFIQTDASINPGNSGGALVDSRGALIGINTAIISKSGGNQGIGFAIPSEMVKRIAKQLIENGTIRRGYLGVGIQDVSTDLRDTYGNHEGAVIISLEADSPAKKAGLAVWDLITKVNDRPIKSSAELRNLIGTMSPNEKVTLTYIRDKQEKTVTLTLAESKDTKGSSKANKKETNGTQGLDGVSVQELSPQIRQRNQIPRDIDGVLVNNVNEESKAYESGLRSGDIIGQIENITIKDLASYKKALEKFKGKSKRILVYSQNGIKTIVIK